ncbi:energy transducer TonB [Pseudomonas floridensis]|uniref:Energy transducer TonB n=1 Tax=Pseudomonas floridensis TaxID=1958950 RepID=A0A1X0MZX8_9PSED|nr:energy transducer TonB [Pseudomonas floridensis]ORC56302.1 energy transducer TonB [Pseudomonas floridensis]
MLNESRRRAYLTAMQVVNWLPRTELPFAAPSRPELLAPLPPPVEVLKVTPAASSPAPAVADDEVPMQRASERTSERPKIEVPRPSLASTRTVAVVEEAEPAAPKAVVVPPPRFALQLLRAGRCLLLVELSTGQPFQSRDPSYLLLKDMLRAAGLPDSPQIIGEPVRWPLLVRGQMDQGPEAARDFVQGFVGARLEDEPCTCLWLVGLPSIKFAGEADAESYNRELEVDGLGTAWALPGLELLMDEPERKADVWKAMRRLMTRWKSTDE